MNPRVSKVIPLEGNRLELIFTNGETGIYDCSPLLSFGVFRELADVRYFRKAAVELGTVVWPNEQDICPDTLYLDSVKTMTKNWNDDLDLAESEVWIGGKVVREAPSAYGRKTGKQAVPMDAKKTALSSRVRAPGKKRNAQEKTG